MCIQKLVTKKKNRPYYLYAMMMNAADTIVALATPPGVGAIGVIRLSGQDAVAITSRIFKGKDLAKQVSHTLHFGHIVDIHTQDIIDEVVVSLYLAPRSYTGENTVEISCHGSPFILQQVVNACTEAGAVPAHFRRGTAQEVKEIPSIECAAFPWRF